MERSLRDLERSVCNHSTFGYEYDPLAGKTIVLTPMKRENKSKICKLTAAVDTHKQAIAELYAQNKLEEALKLIEV